MNWNHEHPSRAALAIGLGGTGVAALAQLKRMASPEWQLQYLAIHTVRDEPALFSMQEYQSLEHPLLDEPGTGGIRLMGHQLIVFRAQEIYAALQSRALEALNAAGTTQLEAYLFAGLSGGVGSCFMDICYILRKGLDDLAGDFSAHITGLFFPADVTLCKPGVAEAPEWAALLRGNEQAAMRELNASTTDGWRFHQEYGNFYVDTTQPPVDDFRLISADVREGMGGYDRAIGQAAQQVLAQLTSENSPPETKGAQCHGDL